MAWGASAKRCYLLTYFEQTRATKPITTQPHSSAVKIELVRMMRAQENSTPVTVMFPANKPVTACASGMDMRPWRGTRTCQITPCCHVTRMRRRIHLSCCCCWCCCWCWRCGRRRKLQTSVAGSYSPSSSRQTTSPWRRANSVTLRGSLASPTECDGMRTGFGHLCLGLSSGLGL